MINALMKRLIFLLSLIGLVVSDPREDFKKYLGSFFAELGEHINLQQLNHCLNNPNTIFVMTKSAVNFIRDMKNDTLINGAYEFKSITKDLVRMLTPCGHNLKILKDLNEGLMHNSEERMIEKFKNRMGEYFHLATTAYGAFCENDYAEAGANVGKMVKMTFLTSSLDLDLEAPMYEFIAGFTQSIGEKKKSEDLYKCAKEDETIFTTLYNAAGLIRTLDPNNMLNGSQVLLDGTKKYIDMLSGCLTGYEVYNKLKNKLQSVDPKSMVQTMNRMLGTFFHLSNNAVEGFEEKRYTLAGLAIGSIHLYLFLK
jgi:hypothetical protein